MSTPRRTARKPASDEQQDPPLEDYTPVKGYRVGPYMRKKTKTKKSGVGPRQEQVDGGAAVESTVETADEDASGFANTDMNVEDQDGQSKVNARLLPASDFWKQNM